MEMFGCKVPRYKSYSLTGLPVESIRGRAIPGWPVSIRGRARTGCQYNSSSLLCQKTSGSQMTSNVMKCPEMQKKNCLSVKKY